MKHPRFDRWPHSDMWTGDSPPFRIEQIITVEGLVFYSPERLYRVEQDDDVYAYHGWYSEHDRSKAIRFETLEEVGEFIRKYKAKEIACSSYLPYVEAA